MANEITLKTRGDEGRYELTVDGERAGELDYELVEGRRVYVHTGIRDAFEGQGLAGQLARHVLDAARADGVQIAATCPYVRSYLAKHPEYQDLVDETLQARLTPEP